MHTDFSITECSHSGLCQPWHVSLSLEMTSSALYISESVLIHSNHYWATRLSWCKPGSTTRLWNRTHWRGKKSLQNVNSSPTKGSKMQTMWCLEKKQLSAVGSAQINCQIVTDMMADHLGQNDVHDAPFTAACLCSFVFMPSPKQRVCQFRGPKNGCVFRQASLARIVHQQVGRRNLSNISSQKYVTVAQGKHSLWTSFALHSLLSRNCACANSVQCSSVSLQSVLEIKKKKEVWGAAREQNSDDSRSHSVIGTTSCHHF